MAKVGTFRRLRCRNVRREPTEAAKSPGESTPPPAPLRSTHSDTFAKLLEHAGISVLVSTYQAGRLIVLRSTGGVVNTHFRAFDVPMGLAFRNHRLALSTRCMVWELGNYPQAGAAMPSGVEGATHDACFIPNRGHVTGDLRTHEIGWGEEGLWLVNTRFSCLCTLASDSSFVPRWRPKFVSKLSDEDRCHLNGMAMVDGRPGLVTVLGQTDTPQGWRPEKTSGGCLIDVSSERVLADGLCMPHSPRLHNGRLWLLESGKGTLSVIDREGAKPRLVAELPGFTRGLAFWDRYAFVGLSQVREKYFSGLPITERFMPEERKCGVWVVDLTTGRIVAMLEFLTGVQEIFDVLVLRGIRFPEVVDLTMPQLASTYVLPDEVLPEVAPARPSPKEGENGPEKIETK